MINNKYYIETYGCQMNVYDSELVANQLKNIGYIETKNLETADIIFLNTCSIREKAEETVHNKLNNLEYLKKKNPNMIIGVLGCMAQNLKNDLLESKPFVDVILGPDSYRKIPEIIRNRKQNLNHVVDTKLSKYEVYNDMFPSRKEGINAWISIMRGCDKFCTFCIVPFTRGRERSRPIESIKKEVEDAVKNGFIEVSLLGQNVNSYLTPEGDFTYLLEELAQINGVKRIRYTSPHPKDMTDDLLYVMKKYDNICNYIHLPLQSGSDKILKRMNRTYNSNEFLKLVQKIKAILPNCSLSTDVIVGFPGESEKDFNDTLEVMKIVEFDFAYMFKYSSRPGTKASQFSDQIEEELKQERLLKLIDLQKKTTLNNNMKLIGSIQDIIIEKKSKKSNKYWSGRTEGNIWTIIKDSGQKIKDQVAVEITGAEGVTLFGKNINFEES
tara:strand:- start:37 stop:1359 length:1323 start_codon:yes stop_codon:yes gene_type:complete